MLLNEKSLYVKSALLENDPKLWKYAEVERMEKLIIVTYNPLAIICFKL